MHAVMKQLAILLLVVAAVSSEMADPRPDSCRCTPPQWEGTQTGIGGYEARRKGFAMTTVSQVGFDRNQSRVYSYTNTTTARGNYSVKIIQDFKSGYQWLVNLKNNTCVKTKLTESFNKGCIPKNAQFMGKLYFGAKGEKLNVKSYRLRLPSEELDVFLTASEKQCIPVTESLMGTVNNVPMVVAFSFIGVTLGIRDPSVFNPPPVCRQNELISLPPTHIHPQFRIFHV